MHYIQKLNTFFEGDAQSPLVLGLAIHKGVETNVETAIKEYLSNYPIITDLQVNEIIKLEYWIPRIKKILPLGKNEIKIETNDFIGFIDYLVKNNDGTYDIYDFKYSNNIEHYLESSQLSIYKFYVEKIYNIKIRNLYFVFIPKVMIRQKKNETLYEFRKRLINELDKKKIQVEQVEYKESHIEEFKATKNNINDILHDENHEYIKNVGKLCNFCEFKSYCEEGNDVMIVLPKNERKKSTINITPDMWLYGDSYSGKTVFMDSFDDNLMVNTDGNVDHITSPVLRVTDEVKTEGRITKRKFAWEVFKEIVTELEKKDNDFKMVTIDLVEDLYEHCRLYMYDKCGWEHESDGGYGKGYDMIKTEFLSTMKRLKNTGYQIVYISKQLKSEVNLKNGSSVTIMKPNINDKIANVLAGTVDLTARIHVDGDKHYMSFKADEYVFGGSRYNFGVTQIPLNKDKFINVMIESQTGIVPTRKEEVIEDTVETKNDADKTENEAVENNEVVRTTRKRRGE